jgi:DNA-binding transcriptional ArsR family regulator
LLVSEPTAVKAEEIPFPLRIIDRGPCVSSWQLIFQHSKDRSNKRPELARPHGGHPPRPLVRLPPRVQIEAAAETFRALGDPERLRLLVRLAAGEACVSELAVDEGEKITTVSARLKTLFAARLVKRRREAKHIFYALADGHLPPMVSNAIDHAAEGRTAVSADLGHRKDITP